MPLPRQIAERSREHDAVVAAFGAADPQAAWRAMDLHLERIEAAMKNNGWRDDA